MLDKLVARLSALRLTLVRGKVRALRPRAAPGPPWDAAPRIWQFRALPLGTVVRGGALSAPGQGAGSLSTPAFAQELDPLVSRDAQDVQARPSASTAAFTTSSAFLAFDLSGLDAFDTFSSGDSH